MIAGELRALLGNPALAFQQSRALLNSPHKVSETAIDRLNEYFKQCAALE